MEIIKPRRDIYLTVGTAAIVIGVLIVLFWAQLGTWLFYYQWLALITLPIMLWKHPFTLPMVLPKKPKFSRWWVRIALIQVILTLTYLAIGQTIISLLASPDHNTPFSINNAFYQTLTDYGLFPWLLGAALSCRIAWIIYKKQEDSYNTALCAPLIQSNPKHFWGIALNTSTRVTTAMIFAITFCLMSIGLAMLLSGQQLPIKSGINSANIALSGVFIVLVFGRLLEKFIKKLLQGPLPPTAILLSALFGFSVLIIFCYWLLADLPSWHYNLPFFSQKIRSQGQTYWLLFSLAWWLGWVPFIAIYSVRYAQGLKLWQIALGLLLLPLAMTITLLLNNYFFKFSWHYDALLNLALGVLSFIVLVVLAFKSDLRSAFMHGVLPKLGKVKHRDYHFYLRRQIPLVGLAFLLALPFGLIGVNLLQFGLICFYLLITVAILIASLLS